MPWAWASGRDPLDEKELPFVYENNGLKVVPTFASVINRGEAPPERQRMPQKSTINFAMVVDGERRITFHKPLPPKCEVVSDERMLAILDKGEGKGAVLMQERVSRDAASGDKLFTIVSSIFARGDGGFGGKPTGRARRCIEIPERAPDLVKECDTRPDQAFLYALSGDRNPLHRDPAFAKMVGFPASHPARAVFLRHRLPRRAVHRGAVPARTHHAVRCALLQAGFSRRDAGGGDVAGRRARFPIAPRSRNGPAPWC